MVTTLADDNGVGAARHGLDRCLGGERGCVVEGSHQKLRPGPLASKAAKQAFGLAGIAEAVQPDLLYSRKRRLERRGDTVSALRRADGLVADIAEDDRKDALVGPSVASEFRKRFTGDIPGEPIVG